MKLLKTHPMKQRLLFTALLALVLVACNREKPQPDPENPSNPSPTTGKLKINFVTTFGAAPFAFYTDYHNGYNQRMQFEIMRFFLTNFYAKKTAGDSILALDAFKYDIDLGLTSVTFNMQPGDYTGMSLAFGIDSTRNHADPTLYDPTHPLSYNQSNTMHWSWASGYIFAKIEGKFDPSGVGTGTPTHLCAFHPGSDLCYQRTPFLPKNFNVTAGSTTNLNLKIDIGGFFIQPGLDTIDLTIDSVTHTFDDLPLARRIAINASKSMWFE